MTEKVPSFKHGGAFWFTDLTTPDSLYIFPILTGLTFLVTVEVGIFSVIKVENRTKVVPVQISPVIILYVINSSLVNLIVLFFH